MPASLLSTTGIIALSVSIAVVLIAAVVVLYFTLFSFLRLKKQSKELISSFEKGHGLLFGQVYQYLLRMDSIASMNLIYVDDFQRLKKEFNKLRDVEDANAQSAVNSLKDLLASRRAKDLRVYLPEAKRTVDSYSENVAALYDTFQKTFAEENEVRAFSLAQKDDFREAKRLFQSRQEDLSLVSETFLNVFKAVDNAFEESDNLIENARYAEAKEVLEKRVKPMVAEIRRILTFLPDVSVTVATIIPDKISSLKNRYEELTTLGYPLNHILLKTDIPEIENNLVRISQAVRSLHLKGVREEIDQMQKRLDGYFDSFQKEVNAREVFEKEWEAALTKENGLEREVVALNNSLPKLKKVYLINSDDQLAIEGVNESINKASSAKQALNTSVHSGTRQPYSSLLKKLSRLQEETNASEGKIRSFQTRLSSLRDDTNRAFLSLASYSKALEAAEVDLRSFELPSIYEKASPIFEDIHNKIDALYAILSSAPINVAAVNRAYDDLKGAADNFLGALKTSKEDLNLAEEAIVRANAYRALDSQTDSTLRQAENLFYKGEFKRALGLAQEALSSIRSRSELSR